MNTLSQIRTLVAMHTAAKEARRVAFATDPRGIDAWKADNAYNPSQEAAVQLLASILPLLEVAAKIELNDGKMPEFQWFGLIGNYETEVAKLLEEVTE